jgi:hypothetical protein
MEARRGARTVHVFTRFGVEKLWRRRDIKVDQLTVYGIQVCNDASVLQLKKVRAIQ